MKVKKFFINSFMAYKSFSTLCNILNCTLCSSRFFKIKKIFWRLFTVLLPIAFTLYSYPINFLFIYFMWFFSKVYIFQIFDDSVLVSSFVNLFPIFSFFYVFCACSFENSTEINLRFHFSQKVGVYAQRVVNFSKSFTHIFIFV